MLLTILKKSIWHYPKSVFASYGFLWLVFEPILGLGSKSSSYLSYSQFVVLSLFLGLIWFLIDGVYFSYFLIQSIEIKSNVFDTRIIITFGDLFKQKGWKAISVNDHFDCLVDDCHISSKSLHGQMLQRYWGGNIEDWNCQVDSQLSNNSSTVVSRDSGKLKSYSIGTTATAIKDYEKFLCVAFSKTDIGSLQTKANTSDLNKAVRSLLCKARSVCADEPLNIPLMGSGLSRVGIKNNILVNLILTAVFEETKANKVTSQIRIILPKEKISEFNLASIKNDWN